MKKRKTLGLTQQNLAEMLHVSFQAVSKWENGTAYPDIELLGQIASALGITVDALLGYPTHSFTDYEGRYDCKDYYWGIEPNSMCYEIMKLKPPTKSYRILDIGCGEGKDAVFFAKNGYIVTAFDAVENGLKKARELADRNGVHVDFFQANILDYRLDVDYDIIYSSGVFHYLPLKDRKDFIKHLKVHTTPRGLNAINVFVKKPFIEQPPDNEDIENATEEWKSGELFMQYHDWFFHKSEEIIFDCNSGGTAHKHCMDTLIAEKGYDH